MNSIDFLPESYHQERTRKGMARRRWVLILLTALTLTGWGLSSHSKSMQLAERAEGLRAEVKSASEKRSEMDRLRAEDKSQVYQKKVNEQLKQPVSVSQTVAAVGRLLPDASGLTSIELTVHRPAPDPLPEPDDKKSKRKTKNKKDEPATVEPDYISVQVQGIAPDDVTVANLVNRMSDYPLFEKVTMHYSRVDERGELISRRFLVGAEVPLDRAYLPTSRSVEVSHAD